MMYPSPVCEIPTVLENPRNLGNHRILKKIEILMVPGILRIPEYIANSSGCVGKLPGDGAAGAAGGLQRGTGAGTPPQKVRYPLPKCGGSFWTVGGNATRLAQFSVLHPASSTAETRRRAHC